jgi:hypothetical protein
MVTPAIDVKSGRTLRRQITHLFGVDLGFQAAGQTDVTVGKIVSEIIHLAVLETTVLIHQFGVLGLALIVIGLTDKLPLIWVPGADKSHDHFPA